MNRLSSMLVVSVVAALASCAQRGPTPAQTTTAAAPQQELRQEVYPSLLRGTQSVELGKLVLMLMPKSGEQVGWDFRSDSAVQWQTNGYAMYPGAHGGAYRRGWIRVNILGAKATALRQRKMELGWTVELDRDLSEGLAGIRSGPNVVSLEPGGDDEDDQCFGSGFDGCDFDAPIDSVAIAGIHVQAICTKFLPGGEKAAFLLTHPGRLPVVMTWERSGGSGGSSADVKLILNASSKISPPDPDGYDERLNALAYTDQALCVEETNPTDN